ncbi:hypothetical protein STXM2123_2761 [Streptomyces sp. F-3]|nr:hypothetical protein STXM2123_2761 [Streptomyces sp. F-3]
MRAQRRRLLRRRGHGAAPARCGGGRFHGRRFHGRRFHGRRFHGLHGHGHG